MNSLEYPEKFIEEVRETLQGARIMNQLLQAQFYHWIITDVDKDGRRKCHEGTVWRRWGDNVGYPGWNGDGLARHKEGKLSRINLQGGQAGLVVR